MRRDKSFYVFEKVADPTLPLFGVGEQYRCTVDGSDEGLLNFSVKTKSAEETRELGFLFASVLRARDVVLMTGSLGAGKTCFVGGVAEALRVKGHVSSPTFTLLHIHEPADKGRPSLNHFDVYRLDGADDFIRHGFDEISYQDGITLIEWGDRVRDALHDDVIELAITYGRDDDERILHFIFPDGREGDADNFRRLLDGVEWRER